MQTHLVLIFLFFGLTSTLAQENTTIISKDSLTSEKIDPLRPAKASFFSAILPGLGQVYNKKYWKVPLVYGAIGTSTYLYLDNQKKYNIYRDEYKNRLAGNVSETSSLAGLDENRLIRIQKGFKETEIYLHYLSLGFIF